MTAAPHSPFPGMDPYIEGWLWPDLHHRLATRIAEQLAEVIGDAYAVQIETQVVEDDGPEEEVGIMIPDVLIHRDDLMVQLPQSRTAVLEPPLLVDLPAVTSLRIPHVEIRRVSDRSLVTCIEIISPANKRGAARTKFKEKWRRLHKAGVHLIDIDLTRRGPRIFAYPQLAQTDYVLMVTRANEPRVGAWPLSVRDGLPHLPVPLAAPDADLVLDLQAAFNHAYRLGRYHLTIDYAGAPPPPPLTPEDADWARERIEAWRAARA